MKTDKRQGMPGIFRPLWIYFLLGLIVDTVAMCIMFFQVGQEKGLPLAMTAETVELVTTYYLQCGTYLAIATAALGIPVFWISYKKDQKLFGTTYTKTKASNYLLAVLLGGAACLVSNNLMFASGALQDSYETQAILDSFYQGNLWIELIGLGIITPICEELMFRGLMYKRARKMMTARWAAIMLSLFFGMFHMNLVQGMYAFLSGLLLCYLYERYQSLLAPLLFHVTSNVISVLGTETKIFSFMYTGKTSFMVMTFAMAVLLVLSVYLIELRVHVREVVEDGTGETKEKVDLV